MKSIQHKILISFCLLIIVNIAILGIVVSWKLSNSISRQSEQVFSDTSDRMHETLHGHYQMLELFIHNIQKHIRRVADTLCKMPAVSASLTSVQDKQLKTILKATAERENIDFAMLFDLEGALIASFPSDLNLFEVEEYFKSWESGVRVQRVLRGEAPDDTTILWDLISAHDSQGLEVFGLSDRDIAGKGAISIASAGIISGDFGDPLGVCLVGKLLNGYSTPLQQLYETTGSAAVIYLDTIPIVQAGFDRAGAELAELSTLQISPEIQAEVYNSDGNKALVFPLAGQPYLTRCSALKSSADENIGMLCVAVPESQIAGVHETIVSYGIAAKQSVQIWIAGIGVLSLILFAILSVVIAGRITRPIKRLSDSADIIADGDFQQEITVTSNDEIGNLANAFRNMQTTIGGVLQEMDGLIQAIQEGRLDTRGNAAAFAGDWRELVDGMNNVIEAFVGPIETTAIYIDRVSQGDIPDTIAEEYKGDFNTIKQNLNISYALKFFA